MFWSMPAATCSSFLVGLFMTMTADKNSPLVQVQESIASTAVKAALASAENTSLKVPQLNWACQWPWAEWNKPGFSSAGVQTLDGFAPLRKSLTVPSIVVRNIQNWLGFSMLMVM